MQLEESPEEVNSGSIPAIDLQQEDHETSTETESRSDESESESSSFEYYSTLTDAESGSDEDESEFLELDGRNDEEEIEESQNIPLDESFGEELNGIGEFIGDYQRMRFLDAHIFTLSILQIAEMELIVVYLSV